jgi:hypothetical protein
MRRFSYLEASSDHVCLQCLLLLGEKRLLKRELKLIKGNDAGLKLFCEVCDFSMVGVVAVDGSEPAPARQTRRPEPESREPAGLPADFVDPMEPGEPEPETPYVPPKTDKEAVERVFGEIVPGDQLLAILENGYPKVVKIGDNRRAERQITSYPMELGDQKIDEYLVEFTLDGQVIFSRKHSSTEGVPDIEAERKALRESCYDAVRPKTPSVASVPAARAPRGPVAVVSQGWGSTATVANNPVSDEDAKTRAALMRLLGGSA